MKQKKQPETSFAGEASAVQKGRIFRADATERKETRYFG